MAAFEQLLGLLTNRRSIRYFSDEPIEKSVVNKILEAGRLAPSVENMQPWHFHVVSNPELKTKLMAASCYGNFVTGAGVFIVTVCDHKTPVKTGSPLWNPKEMEYSCANAVYSMMLGAQSLDIASCWVSLHHGEAHSILGLKEHQTVIGGLMLGHYKAGDEKASKEHDRKPLATMATFHE